MLKQCHQEGKLVNIPKSSQSLSPLYRWYSLGASDKSLIKSWTKLTAPVSSETTNDKSPAEDLTDAILNLYYLILYSFGRLLTCIEE